MSTSSSLRQQFGAFCTNVPLGVRTLLEAPGLTTTLTAPKTALCVCVHPWAKRFSSTGSTVGGALKKRRTRRPVCVQPWTKGFPPPLFLSYMSRGVEQACRAPLNKALCSALRISARTLADVPAFLQAVTPLFLFWFMVFHVPTS